MGRNRSSLGLILAASLMAFTRMAFAQGTAITYQGRLNDGSAPASGNYDLRFTLYDALTNGSVVGVATTNSATAISNGLFTVTLDFGAGAFTGPSRWLEIGARTSGGGLFVALNPRQSLSAAPYAIMAGGVSGVVSNSALPAAPVFSGAVTAGSFVGSGAGVSNVNAAALNGLPSSAFWQLNGNDVGPSNFIGSANNQAVDIKVNGKRALRLQPTASDAPNIIGGSPNNFVRSDVVGATISGGGTSNYLGDTSRTNAISSDFATIAGGFGNRIGTNSPAIAMGGGDRNNVGNSADGATIAGGVINSISDNSYAATIGGGNLNSIGVDSPAAIIAGGTLNQISVNAHHSVISGGDGNKIDANGRWNIIAGGYNNIIGTNAQNSVIGGGLFNTIAPGAHAATIPGGTGNTATNYAFAAGYQAMANHVGTFVWADSQLADFVSTAPNQALIRAAGGVGINNNNPGATLDVNGSLRVGSGTTVFSSLQGGAYQMTNTSSTARTNFTFTFPRPFTTPPKVLLTARNEPAQANATDTFVLSVRSVTTTTCAVNIVRVDAPAGWGQLVMIDWLAWE
jgi:hypothetical protein